MEHELSDLFGSRAVFLIEWPERIAGLLPAKKTIKVELEYIDEFRRKISIIGHDAQID
jgi:tRNA A37 threonylcarbamoyladenosine biosynthesis protein TsaE